MSKSKTDKIKLLTYFALCQNIINFIDGEWNGHPANKQAVKMQSKALLRELEKAIVVLFPRDLDNHADAGDVIDTFMNATDAMESFFVLGMAMDELDVVKKQGLNTQINILLQSYGIDLWEKPMSELWAK
jgi:hypothetical protein